MAACESSMPSSMFTSMICAPFATCCRASSTAAAVVARFDELAKLGRPRDIGAFADIDEQAAGVDAERFKAAQAAGAGDVAARCAAAHPRRRALFCRMCSGVVPQQPPTILRNPLVANSRKRLRRFFRRLIVFAEGIGQARIRVRAYIGVGDARQLLDVRPQLLAAEGAIEADHRGPCMTDRIPKRLGGLSGQGASRGIGDRARDDEGQLRGPPRRTPRARQTAPPWRSRYRTPSRSESCRRRPQSARGSPREYAATSSSKLMLRKPGSLTSGDNDAVRLVGPSAPATKRSTPVCAVTSSATRRARRAASRFNSPTSDCMP